MKIVSIFEGSLYSFQYLDKIDNELDRCISLWTDVNYLFGYAKDNHLTDPVDFVCQILRNVEEIEDYIDDLQRRKACFGFYFRPLQESELRLGTLSLQKGRIGRNRLRIYAVKVELCYVITGGAIKMSQKMQEHTDTCLELNKLQTARNYLKNKGVFDDDSFYELLKN